jgi:hypothetical protein
MGTFLRLLCSLRKAAAAEADMAAQAAAVCALRDVVLSLFWMSNVLDRAALKPLVVAAMEAGSLLLHGDGCSSGPGGCSCCLPSTASTSTSGGGGDAAAADAAADSAATADRARALPILSLGRQSAPLPTYNGTPPRKRTRDVMCEVLVTLTLLQFSLHSSGSSTPPPVATNAARLVSVQLLALSVAHVRGLRGRAARAAGGAGAPAVPGCADLAAFLGGADTSAVKPLVAEWEKDPAAVLVLQSEILLQQLAAAPATPSSAALPCTPEQVLLAIEAVTAYPERAAQASQAAAFDLQSAIAQLAELLTTRHEAGAPWVADVLRRGGAATLAAWVLAVGPRLSAPRASSGPGVMMPAGLLQIVSALVRLPVRSPPLEQPLPLAQLLTAAEHALRLLPAATARLTHGLMGLDIVTVRVGGREELVPWGQGRRGALWGQGREGGGAGVLSVHAAVLLCAPRPGSGALCMRCLIACAPGHPSSRTLRPSHAHTLLLLCSG